MIGAIAGDVIGSVHEHAGTKTGRSEGLLKRIEETWQLLRHRLGLDSLPAHLEHRYSINVANLKPLDAGVYRVDLREGPR